MKAPQLFLTLLFGISLFAQNNTNKNRYQYSLILNTDTKIDMVLDINNDTSYFAEKLFISYQNNLLHASQEKDKKISFELLKNAAKQYNRSNYIVIKTTSKENITFEKFKNQKFQITENRDDLKWNIDDTLFNWNNFNVKKATTVCDGRFWTVYFTKDINVESGPYKFNNLPGFVVKAWDKTNQFDFEYQGVAKIDAEPIYVYKPEVYDKISLHEKKVLKEVFYPHIASKKNDSSRATSETIKDIENAIDLSFVDDVEYIN
jgi:GLPGLI family protein